LNKAWYQEAIINGVKMPFGHKPGTSERRWLKFIEPHIPSCKGRALDFGCNAGFYSRKLADLGFDVTGMDKDVENALFWESNDPKGIRIIEGNINDWDFPYASVAIAACVLYWQTQGELEILEERLRSKVAHVIVMGRNRWHKRHISDPRIENISNIFREWDRGEVIVRGRHYSTVFKNRKIYPVKVSEIDKMKGVESENYRKGFARFIELVLAGKPFDIKRTLHYKYIRAARNVDRRIQIHIDMIKDVEKTGIIHTPLKIRNGRVLDGRHRLGIAKHYGMEELICEDSSIG